VGLQVRKKDGRLEPFDRDKVKNGMLKSGASDAEAETVTGQVETWAQGVAQDGIVDTLEIRAKVLEILRGVNPGAAAAFEAYQKPSMAQGEDNQYPEEESSSLE